MYHIGFEIPSQNTYKTKLNQDVYLCPYMITTVRDNDIDRDHKDRVKDPERFCIPRGFLATTSDNFVINLLFDNNN